MKLSELSKDKPDKPLDKVHVFSAMNENAAMKSVHFQRPAPVAGRASAKARRLVSYCMGPFETVAMPPCSQDLDYLSSNQCVLLLRVSNDKIELQNLGANEPWDQKKIVEALISQGAKFPAELTCWLITKDQGSRLFDPGQGLHICGMRNFQHPDVVLVPTSNRNRVLGPNLARQAEALKEDWTRWEDKSDTAWWGGALTGMRWNQSTSLLSRMRVLSHFSEHPDRRVYLQPTLVPDHGFQLPDGIALQQDFTKKEVFRHKCIILLPGNDIASGASWYFGGNSVVLMPPPHMDHILFFELNPWEHYVPLEEDPSDILVKLDWVLDNQEEARRIVRRAHERLHWLAGPEYLWACNEVLRQIAPGSKASV